MLFYITSGPVLGKYTLQCRPSSYAASDQDQQFAFMNVFLQNIDKVKAFTRTPKSYKMDSK